MKKSSLPIRSRFAAALACAALAGLTTAADSSQITSPAVDRVDFNYQIRPLLSDRCFRCHGPDASKRKAKLRLDTREGAFKEIDDGWAIVKPGDPGRSEIIRRIHADYEDDVMPPPESHLTLSDAEKALLKRWIAEGADYKPHWSFMPVPRSTCRRIPTWRRRQSHRRVRARAARKERLRAARAPQACRPQPRDAAAPPRAQPDGPAAHACRDRRVPRRPIARRLRAGRRSLPRLAGLRRAHGDGLARPRALRRHLRLSGRRRPRHVAVARLGDRRVQRATCPTISSSPGSSPAICCRTRRASSASRPPSIACIVRRTRAAASRRSSAPSTSSIACTPSAPRCSG